MKAFDAVVAGHICLDIIPEMPALPFDAMLQPGTLTEVGASTMQTGGPVSNTGRNLQRLGLRTRLCGKVGEDAFGQIVLDLIRRQDPTLAEDMIRSAGSITSYSIVISPPGRDRVFLHCPGANHDYGADDVPYDRLRDARLLHFGYPPYMQRFYAHDGTELV